MSVLREPTVRSRDRQGDECQNTKHYTEESRGTGRALVLRSGQERPEDVWTEVRFEGQLRSVKGAGRGEHSRQSLLCS